MIHSVPLIYRCRIPLAVPYSSFPRMLFLFPKTSSVTKKRASVLVGQIGQVDGWNAVKGSASRSAGGKSDAVLRRNAVGSQRGRCWGWYKYKVCKWLRGVAGAPPGGASGTCLIQGGNVANGRWGDEVVRGNPCVLGTPRWGWYNIVIGITRSYAKSGHGCSR